MDLARAPAERRGFRWRAALAGLFLFVFAVAALSGPGRIDIVDGQTRYEVARSLAVYGDSVIRDKDVWFAVLPGRDGLPHTNYRFPQSGLGVLAIWAADATGPADESRRHFFFTLIGPLACALLALTYAVWFRGLGHGPGASLAWAAAGVFCTPNWYYATSTFDDMLAAAAVVPAVAVAFLTRRALWGGVAAGLLLGWAYNCKQPLAIFILPVLAALYRPGVPLRRQLAPAALVCLGLALGAVACKLYDLHKFPPGTCDPDRDAVSTFGAVWNDSPLPGLLGLAFSPSAGALWYCPTLILSIVGWRIWRRERRVFCDAVLAASLGFFGFVSCLTFFKGEPCWGPRYLTPVFALAWVFVPAAAAQIRRGAVALLLGLGCFVQLLALSVDPQRLYLQLGVPSNYFLVDSWLGFRPEASHLLQRPRELCEVLTGERAPAYSTGPTPTHAPTLPSGYPAAVASTVGLGASDAGMAPLSAAGAYVLRPPVHARAHLQAAAEHYHVFAGPRVWWASFQYLPQSQRPVDLTETLLLFAGAAALGLTLIAAGARGACTKGDASI